MRAIKQTITPTQGRYAGYKETPDPCEAGVFAPANAYADFSFLSSIPSFIYRLESINSRIKCLIMGLGFNYEVQQRMND